MTKEDRMYGRCPACGYTWEPGYGDSDEEIIIAVHPALWEGPLYTERCWLVGWTLAEGKDMVRMRTENGGRLAHAAHP